MSQTIDSRGESIPLRELGLQQLLASPRQAVVLARGSIGGLLPGGIDDTFALQAPEEWVESAFGRGQRPAHRTQCRGQLVAIARANLDERQHAQFDDASARLGEPLHGKSSVPHSTLLHTVARVRLR